MKAYETQSFMRIAILTSGQPVQNQQTVIHFNPSALT